MLCIAYRIDGPFAFNRIKVGSSLDCKDYFGGDDPKPPIVTSFCY
jgi:hypothetical protein